jgi:ABC-2 type transport system ATP-binding protein
MKATIVGRAEAGAAVILSSHLLHLVEEVCTRLMIMNRGRSLALGSIDEILSARPDMAGRTLEEVFVGIVGADASGDQ